MFILLTGQRGSGKTTACWKALSELRGNGCKVAGFISPPLLDATGKKTLVAADGVVTELPYKDVQRVYNGANGRLYAVTDEAGKTGVIDWHGNILVPLGDHPGYDIKSDTANTLVTVKNRDTGKLEVYKVPQV